MQSTERNQGAEWFTYFLDPIDVLFSQESIHPYFNRWGLITDYLDEIDIVPQDNGVYRLIPLFPIPRLLIRETPGGERVYITMDNRRLCVLQLKALELWPGRCETEFAASLELPVLRRKAEWIKISGRYGTMGNLDTAVRSSGMEWDEMSSTKKILSIVRDTDLSGVCRTDMEKTWKLQKKLKSVAGKIDAFAQARSLLQLLVISLVADLDTHYETSKAALEETLRVSGLQKVRAPKPTQIWDNWGESYNELDGQYPSLSDTDSSDFDFEEIPGFTRSGSMNDAGNPSQIKLVSKDESAILCKDLRQKRKDVSFARGQIYLQLFFVQWRYHKKFNKLLGEYSNTQSLIKSQREVLRQKFFRVSAENRRREDELELAEDAKGLTEVEDHEIVFVIEIVPSNEQRRLVLYREKTISDIINRFSDKLSGSLKILDPFTGREIFGDQTLGDVRADFKCRKLFEGGAIRLILSCE